MFLLILAVFGVLGIVSSPKAVSDTERRPLAQMPDYSKEALLNGRYFSGLETYTVDQFPFRDTFRRLKAVVNSDILQRSDNNGYYQVDGYLAKLDYPVNEKSVDHAAERMALIYESYLKNGDHNVIYTVIPDKNYFLARPNGYPAMDYASLVEQMENALGQDMTYVDIFDALQREDYYKTDTHWRQECLDEVVSRLAGALAISEKLTGEYEMRELTPFYGVYSGQSALFSEGESLFYLTNETLENCTVYNAETNAYGTIYDLERFTGQDPYEVFLSGSQAILIIDNPANTSGKKLVIFRDSFGSSLAPLLVEAYSQVILVDIRYVGSSFLDRFLTLEGDEDVLFAYSTLILNSSSTMK